MDRWFIIKKKTNLNIADMQLIPSIVSQLFP